MKTATIMMLALVGSLVAACSEPPVKTGNSSEVQRAHAEQGQRELSSEVKK